MERRVLVTGASGFVSKRLVNALAKEGWQVKAAARDPGEILAPTSVERAAMSDLAEAADWSKLLDGVTHVVHLAGIAHAPGSLPDALYTRINAEAAGELANAARGKVERFVFISSSAAHEPMRARTAYSASKAGMNAFALALAQEVDRDGINVHIVTPGPVETDMLQDVPFEMWAIRARDVADAVAWLDTLDPSVDLPEIRLHAITRGPSARAPIVPLGVERRAARTK